MKKLFPRILMAAGMAATAGSANAYTEAPSLAARVAAGELPAVEERLPEVPLKTDFEARGLSVGRYGGMLRMLMGRPKDTRMMVVYGYARLVGYTPEWSLMPDILESVDVEERRVFTLKLRKGHKWSDGHPFTSEDFRYYWEDFVNDADLSSGVLPRFLLVDGEPPKFEAIDETTVRYTWNKPNPFFLPALAGARPEYIFMPAHYMKKFHTRHADGAGLAGLVKDHGQRNWVALHYNRGNQYENDNPDLPTLQPWMLKTVPPSTRFIFQRNPYFHRVDAEGQQLPYIDSVAFSVTNSKLIPAKTAAGDSDLQARGIGFENYTVLKQGEKRNDFTVRLWKTAVGSELALLPNLNVNDPEWRKILRDANFRRALSLAVNRKEISRVIFFGLAKEGNDTVLPESPLYKPEYAIEWAEFDPDQANRLLDEIGLGKRDGGGTRLLPDGRPASVLVETSGENPTEVDVLQLITDHWSKIGIGINIKPQQREVLRNRVFAGSTVMSVWSGIENALPNADMSPHELAPTSQIQLYWPKWGQYYETGGRAGEPVDLEPAKELADLNRSWITETDQAGRAEIWHRMLKIRAGQVFTIGTVREVPQPVVVAKGLNNVPEEAVYNWEPGAHFGVYHPDTFWFEEGAGSRTE